MGHQSSVYAIKPWSGGDDRFVKMKAVWDACTDAGVAVPAEVDLYFEGKPPNELVHPQFTRLNGLPQDDNPLRLYSDDSSEGYEVDLDKLPPGTKILRFCCSW